MKRIALVTVCLVAAVGMGYGTHPNEFAQYTGAATKAALRVRDNVEANPVPVVLALGTFVLTVVYHKARGKTLRESVEVAATRVTVVPVSPKETQDHENLVVKRAKARAMRAQLLSDQINLQNRHRKLPEEILKAEKEACYTQQALADAERTLGNRRKAHDEALAKLEALRKVNADSEAELAEIEVELKKLADVV
ncbi:MAG: hypothetical protein JWO38_4787 [Gemmataceae bacterium]|nr:hypothetical protein [Gemmataceae bacterium]